MRLYNQGESVGKKRLLLINVNPSRDSEEFVADKRVIEYHKAKNTIGVERGDQRQEPNNGLLSIGSMLIKSGYEVKYLDLNAQEVRYFHEKNKYYTKEKLCQIVEKQADESDFVLISSLTPAFTNALAIAEHIKDISPKKVIILGGIFATLNPDYCFKYRKSFDVIVIGEGEIIAPKIIDAYSRNDFSVLKKEEGIIYRKPGNKRHIIQKGHNIVPDLNSLDLPAFQLLEEESKPFVYRVVSARGCSSACLFCAPSYVSRHKLREYSVESVLEYLKKLKNDIKPGFFIMGDLTFLDNEKQGREVLRRMIKEKINIPFWCQTRLDRMNEENLRLLSKAGCKQIAIGIETYNNSILTMINKGIRIDDVVKKFIMAKRYGMEVQAYLIVGLPSETKENTERTISFTEYAIRKGFLDLTHISLYVPYPGLPVPKNVNIIDKNYDHYYQGVFLDMPPTPVYETKGLTKSEILELFHVFLDRVTKAFKGKEPIKISDYKKYEKESVIGVEALAIAEEISSYGKKSVFNIVQGMRSNKKSFISKIIHNGEKFAIGDSEICTIYELKSVLDVVDGLVDYILLDTDVKNNLSNEFINEVYKTVKKSKILSYSDIELWCKSVFITLQDELGDLRNKTILISPRNIFSRYLALMFKLAGNNVVYGVGGKINAYVSFAFGDNPKNNMIKELPGSTIIVDATTEGINSELYRYMAKNKQKVVRPELRPMMDSYVCLIEGCGNNTRGYFDFGGYRFVSGGFVGVRNDIVVDSVDNPSKVLGLADGRGKIIQAKDIKKEDIFRIQGSSFVLEEYNEQKRREENSENV
jgi:radical SAM superfamily enzyme YgiQ (UPF0313 family)